jgi:predicted outer membrane repeat protein
VIDSNIAVNAAGAVYTEGNSIVYVHGSIITNNRADDDGGGGFYVQDASVVTTERCTMTRNMAIYGGVAFITDTANFAAFHSTMSLNRGYTNGGALFVDESAHIATLGVTVTENAALYGAVFADDSSDVVLAHSTFAFNGNHASGGVIFQGGALYLQEYANVHAHNVTLAGNSAARGGAVYTSGASTLVMTDCSVASNSALEGGGIHACDSSFVNATRCSFEENVATSLLTSEGGGAVRMYDSAAVYLSHCDATLNRALEVK